MTELRWRFLMCRYRFWGWLSPRVAAQLALAQGAVYAALREGRA